VLQLEEVPPIEHDAYIGDTTNNQAEYQALVAGIKHAHELGVTELECFLDSELVVKQLNGQYRVKDPDLKPHHTEITALTSEFQNVTYSHVRRAQNKEADALVNKALDARN